MTKDEALDLALEALKEHEGNYKLGKEGVVRHEKAIDACEQALAAPVISAGPITPAMQAGPTPEQKKQMVHAMQSAYPAAPVQDCFWKREGYKECPAAQRQWVGLTDDERLEVAEIDGADEWFWKVCKAIEAKLKEKNT
jgi:hypothetical protein